MTEREQGCKGEVQAVRRRGRGEEERKGEEEEMKGEEEEGEKEEREHEQRERKKGEGADGH